MTIPILTQDEFLKLLKDNGWDVVCNDYWEEFGRVILQKGEENFPLQLKRVYSFPTVVRTCQMLGIEPPPDHLLCHNQWEEEKKRNGKK